LLDTVKPATMIVPVLSRKQAAAVTRPDGDDEIVQGPTSSGGNRFTPGPMPTVTSVPGGPCGGGPGAVTCTSADGLTVNAAVALYPPPWSFTWIVPAPAGAVFETAKVPVTVPVDDMEQEYAGVVAITLALETSVQARVLPPGKPPPATLTIPSRVP